ADGAPITEENNTFGLGATSYVGSARFRLHDFGDVSGKTGEEIRDLSVAAGVLRFQRVEDGAWVPEPEPAPAPCVAAGGRRERDFYFATTATFPSNSRLWRLRFDDIERPEDGGTIDIVLRSN